MRPSTPHCSLSLRQRRSSHALDGRLELGLDELKTEQLDREETLRSKSPWAIRQEIWGLMIGYNLVRRHAAECAARQDVSPTRISFVAMLRQIRDRWMILAIVGMEVEACVGTPASARGFCHPGSPPFGTTVPSGRETENQSLRS